MCASVTLRLVLAAYGLENVRPYRVGAGRNNEHWYVGAGLVLRRYGTFRSDAALPVAGPPDLFPRILEMPADPAWQRLDALDDPVLNGLIRRKLAEVREPARLMALPERRQLRRHDLDQGIDSREAGHTMDSPSGR